LAFNPAISLSLCFRRMVKSFSLSAICLRKGEGQTQRRCWVSRENTICAYNPILLIAQESKSPMKLAICCVLLLPPHPIVSSLPNDPSSARAFYTILTLFRPYPLHFFKSVSSPCSNDPLENSPALL
jgi:hypothetical protein